MGQISDSNYPAAVNIVGFDTSVGKDKPRTLTDDDTPCPFCDVAHLKDIVDRQGSIILLKNKYNVIKGAEQFVIIESDVCHSDMPDYTAEHMRRLFAFALRHWRLMLKSSRYEAVLFFKNYGALSGGTIRHPHMQLVGFPRIDKKLFFGDEREFFGIDIAERNGVLFNVSTYPRIGFGELNIVPQKDFSSDTAADFMQIGVDYLTKHFVKGCGSYNIFFYDNGGNGDRFFAKIMPRFATPPLFVGYNIRFVPSNVAQIAEEIRTIYAGRLR